MIPEFTQNDFDARQGEEALVGFKQPVVSHLDASLKPKPRVGPLNDVAQAIPVRARVLPKFRPAAARSFIVPLRDDRRDPALPQSGAERATIVGAVRQQPPRPSSASSSTPTADRDASENAVSELQFMDVGALKSEGDRGSVSVDED